jgi:adenosylcobinamide-phosphate synthase
MVVASWICGYSGVKAWRIMLRDGRKHLSPNAGIPEAVIAGALELQLGGPSNYAGAPVNKPFIGDSLKKITINDISNSHRVMFVTSLLSLLFFVWSFIALGIW